jgi:hypothetical protein
VLLDPECPTRLLTDASELAVSSILEQPDAAGVFHRVAFVAQADTPRAFISFSPAEASGPFWILEVAHALKTLLPNILDRPFELHTDSKCAVAAAAGHVTSHQPRWLNLLSEFQYCRLCVLVL